MIIYKKNETKNTECKYKKTIRKIRNKLTLNQRDERGRS